MGIFDSLITSIASRYRYRSRPRTNQEPSGTGEVFLVGFDRQDGHAHILCKYSLRRHKYTREHLPWNLILRGFHRKSRPRWSLMSTPSEVGGPFRKESADAFTHFLAGKTHGE